MKISGILKGFLFTARANFIALNARAEGRHIQPLADPAQPYVDMPSSRVDAQSGDTTLIPYMEFNIFLHVYSPRENP